MAKPKKTRKPNLLARILPYAVGVVLVVAAAVTIFWALGNSNDKHNSTNKNSADPVAIAKPKRACAIFTLAVAKKLLGDNTKGGELGTSPNSDDQAVSTCSYSKDTGSNAPTSARSSAMLVVQAPKTEAGVTTNQKQFESIKSGDYQTIEGYGEAAYWTAQFGQLHILKNNIWYILSFGPITPENRTLDQTRQLADLLINKM